jgi:hypothetical protein
MMLVAGAGFVASGIIILALCKSALLHGNKELFMAAFA